MRPPTMRAFAPLALLAVLALLPVLTVVREPPRAGAAGPKNIVLIVLDDLDAGSLERMPNVRDLLQKRGTSFANFFVATPSCCPSRASILRGQYSHNHGVLQNEPPHGGFQTFRDLGHERSTVATWLDAAGYRTALVGKYLNGYETDPRHRPPGWDQWYALTGAGQYFDYTMNENGELVDYGDEPRDYETDVLRRKALDFIRRADDAGQPFFLYLAPHAPHYPSTPAPRHEGRFDDVKAPRVPSFNEADVSDKPRWVQEKERLTRRQVKLVDELYGRQLRSLLAVDEMVKAIHQTLQETGGPDTTYVVLTSDNGHHWGEHRMGDGKGTPYEESIRVPLIVRGPGVPAGRTVRGLASNVDLAPTFAEWAGLAPPDVPAFVDGRSLAPLLGEGQPTAWRQAVLVEYIGAEGLDRFGAEGPTLQGGDPRLAHGGNGPPFRALRTAYRAYVEYRTGERELYDLAADPFQLRNLANDPVRADEIAGYQRWLEALRGCAGQGCRGAEDAPPAG